MILEGGLIVVCPPSAIAAFWRSKESEALFSYSAEPMLTPLAIPARSSCAGPPLRGPSALSSRAEFLSRITTFLFSPKRSSIILLALECISPYRCGRDLSTPVMPNILDDFNAIIAGRLHELPL
jgi:hypothetical protein